MKSSTCIGLYSRPMQSQSRHLIGRPLRPLSAILICAQMFSVLTMTDFDLKSPAVILISFQLAHRDIVGSP